MASLYCAVCSKYEDSLQSLKSILTVWITGSLNQKVSNVLDHASSKVHKVAMTRKRADTVKANSRFAMLHVPSMISCCLSMLDNGT